MEYDKTRIGLPIGSLNKRGRAETSRIFKDAGKPLDGYEPEEEDQKKLKFKDKKLSKLFSPQLIRPQNLPMQLSYGFLDAGISGMDCIEEGQRNGYNGHIEPLYNLKIGYVRIVAVAHKEHNVNSLGDLIERYHNENKILRCFTEYPHIAFNRISENKTYKELYGKKHPITEIKGIKSGGTNKNIQIIYSFGKSESLVGKENIGVENTQTGRTLDAYELKILEQIMESEAWIFIRKDLPEKEPWKYEQILMLTELLKNVNKNSFNPTIISSHKGEDRTQGSLNIKSKDIEYLTK